MIMTTSLVAILLAPAAFAAPSSDAVFANAVGAASAEMRAAFRTASWNEEDALLDLLRDGDPEVRRQAVRSLKAWVWQRSSTKDRILDVYRDAREALAVRREAAKTLSAASGNWDVHRELLDYAKRGADASLRAVSYKALYWVVAQRNDVRDDVLDAARRETDKTVRLAAIWALFASNDNRVKDELRDLARRAADEDVRVEALKSGWGYMGYNDFRGDAYDLARNTASPAAVRRAAILLHANRVESRQKDLLEDIARRDSDPAMRQAAITALGAARSEEIQAFFHLVRRGHNGVVVYDPLDAE